MYNNVNSCTKRLQKRMIVSNMRKIKFILIFLIVVVLKGFMISADNQIQLVITASFDSTNTQVSSRTETAPYGTRLSLDSNIFVDNGYSFLYWIINDVIQQDLPLDHEHIITSTLEAHAVFHPNNQYVATFIDTNGIVLDFQYINPGENADDTHITLPNKPGYVVAPFKWDKALANINNHTIFTVQYLEDELPNLNLTVNQGTGSGTYAFNTIVTIEADAVYNDQHFQYWTYQDNIFSYNRIHQFTLLESMNITAVYADDPILPLPHITLSNDLARRSGYKSYLGQLFIPTGYELIEYGVITSQHKEYLDLGSSNIHRYQGISLNPSTQEFVMSITETSHQYVQGYLVVKNFQNELLTFYANEKLMDTYFIEDFETSSFPSGTTYGDGTFVGLHGIIWTYGHSVDSGAYQIDGKGILFRNSKDSFLSSTISGGINSFSFEYKKAFTGSANRIIEVTINGQTYETPSFGNFSGEDSTIFNFSLSNLNIETDAEILIKLKGSSTTNAHVVIDNITWSKLLPSRNLPGYILATSSNIEVKPTVSVSGPYYVFEEELELNAPVVADYTFIQWVDLRTGEILSEHPQYIFDIISNRSIHAVYEPNSNVAEYTIEHYYENIEDNIYTLSHVETIIRPIGEFRTIQPNQYGYSIDTDLSVLSGYVSYTEPLILKVYYERNLYQVDFMVDDFLYQSQMVKFQAVPEAVVDPYKVDDPFDGWSVMSIGRTLYNLSLPITQNLTLYAVFESTPDYVYEGYYEGADDLSGEGLVSFLRTLVNTDFNRRSYDQARYDLEYIDEDPNNTLNVLTIYDRQSVNGTWDGGITWNREHVWPNSRLGIPRVKGSQRNIGTDLHNLRAAIPSTNS